MQPLPRTSPRTSPRTHQEQASELLSAAAASSSSSSAVTTATSALAQQAIAPVDLTLRVLSLNNWKITDGSNEISAAALRAEFERAIAAESGVILTDNEMKLLTEIRNTEHTLTPRHLTEYVMSAKPSIPSAIENTPLLRFDIPQSQVLKAALQFMGASSDHRWDDWFNLFDKNNSLYIADTNELLVGREQIKKIIGGQLDWVKSMKYKIIGLQVVGNRVWLASVNCLKTKKGEDVYFLNDTVLYLDGFETDGTPRFLLNLDVIDKGAAKKSVIYYTFKNMIANCFG